MSEETFGDMFRNIRIDDAIRMGTSFLISGFTSFIWISLPFFLRENHIPLFYLGLIYSIAVLSAVLIRLPLRFYSDRARSDLLPTIGLLLTGISMSLLFTVKNVVGIILAFVVLSLAVAAYRSSKNASRAKGLRNMEPMRNMYSQDIIPNTGIFIVMIFAALFVGGSVGELYGIMSVIALLAGFLALMYRITNGTRSSISPSPRPIRQMIKTSFEPIKSLDMITNRKIMIPYIAIQSLLYLSICIVAVFLPAMGLHDGVSRQEVFLIFAAFSVIAFLLDRSAALIPMKFVRDTFYMFRPIFLIIPLLLLSLISSSVIFIIGYFTLLLWVFSDSMSSDVVSSMMPEGDRIRAPIIMGFLSIPISIIGPALGSIFWLASPRLLYGVAILPAAISLLLAMMAFQNINRHKIDNSIRSE